MTPEELVLRAAAVTVGLGILWGAARIVAKLVRGIDHLMAETTPNGGSSMKDQLARVEAELLHARKRHHELITDVSVVKGELELHIDRHPPAYPRRPERPPGL